VRDFEYHRPGSVKEACVLLSRLKGRVAALGGGTEIIVDLKSGAKRFDHLVALDGVEDLRTLKVDKTGLTIGAMVTPGMLSRSKAVRKKFPEIVEVTDVFAARQVGNRATIGGNIAAAVPSADFPPILIALGASVEFVGRRGKRRLPLEKAFAGPRKSALRKGEVISRIRVPARKSGTGARYLKFGLRDAQACAVAGVAAAVRQQKGKCRSARIVLAAVAPVPLLVEKAAKKLVGRKIDPEAILEAARAAREACAPISDLRGTKEYRWDLIETLTRRAITAAVERAGKSR
jgi:carbon-monoxide dehydrogenase medium subunit